MSVTEVEADERPCQNPDCDNEHVEPEVDGDHRYWECEDCGYAFGYERIDESTRIEGNCSIGVPEDVRRQASAPMEAALHTSEVNVIAGPRIPVRGE